MSSIFIAAFFAILLFLLLIWRSHRKISYVCLIGKTALITGAARGIGYYTALDLAARGCRVIIADVLDAEDAKNTIIRKTNNSNIVVKRLDLADLESVRRFAKEINETEERLDILINNAGIGSRKPQKTKDGLDLVMQVNYFGGFLLTHLLADLLKKSAPSRIIFISSILSYLGKTDAETVNGDLKDKYFFIQNGVQLYANSKFCGVVAADGFAERLGKYNVTSIPVRPMHGASTSIFEESDNKNFLLFTWKINPWPLILALFAEHPSETAAHIAYVSVAQELEGEKGFFTNSKKCWKPRKAKNRQLCNGIWEATEKLVGLKASERLL